MKKFTLLFLLFVMAICTARAQTMDEMKADMAAKETELTDLQASLEEMTAKADALKAEVDALADQITPYPRWDRGILGSVGANISGFNNWLLLEQSNIDAVNITFSSNGFINADFEKSFWRNNANLVLGWQRFDNRDTPEDSDEFQVSADAFNVSSLYGFKLSPKWAVSALGEYRTSVLDGRFNNPGYLDLGIGATWTPITDLVVVVHPLNYNFVFSDNDEFDFQSSLGAKVVADYSLAVTDNIAWKSNLSAFLSYEGSELSNYTWINSVSTAVRGVGVRLELGLRSNEQEAMAAMLDDNPIQSYWLIGLSYAIASKE